MISPAVKTPFRRPVLLFKMVMSTTILVVKPEGDFLSRLTPMLLPHAGLIVSAAHIPTFPISLANEGETVRVHSSPHDSRIEEQLTAMGIYNNDDIMVVNKQPGGALVVQKNGNRFALGVGMAHKLMCLRCSASILAGRHNKPGKNFATLN